MRAGRDLTGPEHRRFSALADVRHDMHTEGYHGRVAWLATMLLAPLLAGCVQRPGGWRFPFSFARPADGATAAGATDPGLATDAIANAADGAMPNSGVLDPNLQQRWSLFGDLRRRAAEQRRLAEVQQRELDQLRLLQRDIEREKLALQQEQARSRQHDVQAKVQQELATLQEQRKEMGRLTDAQRRMSKLDTDNQDLQTQLAQSQQQSRLLEDQANLLRRQLQETADQLAQSHQAREMSEQRLQALQASARRRSGATITANNSLRRSLTAVQVPGLDIRQDGDLVRITLPSDQIFLPGTATLHQGSQTWVDQVLDVIRSHYPNQIVGVEAHHDHSSLAGTLWRNAHQLTAAQAMAVFEQCAQAQHIDPRQLFVMGHGGNHPIASNANPAGQARNRRIEIVIYPETIKR